jgi:hypothetical protein
VRVVQGGIQAGQGADEARQPVGTTHGLNAA